MTRSLRKQPFSASTGSNVARTLPMRVCLAFGLLLAIPALAEPIKPPLEQLYAPSNVLIVAKLLSVEPAGQIVLKRKKVLSGRQAQPELIRVRVSPQMASRLKPGARYIAGYTVYLRDPRNRKGQIANPEGPVLLSTAGLEPALLPDSHLLRAILAEAHERKGGHGEQETPQDPDQLLGLLLKALRSSDRQLQNLAANELSYAPEVSEGLDTRGQAYLHEVVNDPAKSSAARSALLQAARHNPARFGNWWRSAAQNILASAPVGGYINYINMREGLDGLAMAAFSILQVGDIGAPADALVRWVGSENPALSERALLMLHKQSPARESAAIKQALANPHLPGKTRRFLLDYQHRLDILQNKRR